MSLVNESFAPKSKQERQGIKARTVRIGKSLDWSPSHCFPLWAVLQATLPTQASVFSFAQWALSLISLGALRWQGRGWRRACLLARTLQVVNSGSMSSFASSALAWRLAPRPGRCPPPPRVGNKAAGASGRLGDLSLTKRAMSSERDAGGADPPVPTGASGSTGQDRPPPACPQVPQAGSGEAASLMEGGVSGQSRVPPEHPPTYPSGHPTRGQEGKGGRAQGL